MTKKAKALGDASKHSFVLAHQYGIRVALGTDYSNSPNTPFHEIGKEFYSLDALRIYQYGSHQSRNY